MGNRANFIAALSEIQAQQGACMLSAASRINWRDDHSAIASRQDELRGLAEHVMHAAADALEVIAAAGTDRSVASSHMLIVEGLQDLWTECFHKAWAAQRETAADASSPAGRADDAADRAYDQKREREAA